MAKIRFHYYIVKLIVRFWPKLFERYYREYLEGLIYSKTIAKDKNE